MSVVCFLFWLFWVFVATRGLYRAAERGCSSLQCEAYRGGLSSCRAQAVGRMGFRSCGSRAPEHGLNSVACGLSCSVACGVLSDQGLKLSPALAGRLSTTEPPGEPPAGFSYSKYLWDGKYLAKPCARWWRYSEHIVHSFRELMVQSGKLTEKGGVFHVGEQERLRITRQNDQCSHMPKHLVFCELREGAPDLALETVRLPEEGGV